MSDSVNGTSVLNPIPSNARLHCVATFSQSEHVLSRFFEALPERCKALGAPGDQSWTVIHEPRFSTFTDLTVGDWTVRIVFDAEGLAPTIRDGVVNGQLSQETLDTLEQHEAAVLIFLTRAPARLSPWEVFHGFCQLAWAWVDAGATVLAFPEGRVALVRRLLLGLEPQELEPEHAYLFLSNGVERIGDDHGQRIIWLRTWGLGQFLLPDLAVALPAPEGELSGEDLESLRLLFETLPPSMIKAHGILPVGGTVQVGPRTWTATGPPQPDQCDFMTSRLGFQLLA
jgi:hypothetical protein